MKIHQMSVVVIDIIKNFIASTVMTIQNLFFFNFYLSPHVKEAEKLMDVHKRHEIQIVTIEH